MSAHGSDGLAEYGGDGLKVSCGGLDVEAALAFGIAMTEDARNSGDGKNAVFEVKHALVGNTNEGNRH